jgi:hypothetical protein
VAEFRVKHFEKFNFPPALFLCGEIVSAGDSPSSISTTMFLRPNSGVLDKDLKIWAVYPEVDPSKCLRLEVPTYDDDVLCGLSDWIGEVQCGDVLEIV